MCVARDLYVSVAITYVPSIDLAVAGLW
jgi:hypothetical protein